MYKTYAQKILDGKYKIPISSFQSCDYCSRQIYLRFVAGIKVKSNAMACGEQVHAALDAEHAAVATPMSLEEILEVSLEKPEETFVMRGLKVECKKLIGEIDEIQIKRDSIVIIDDKPIKNNKVWDGQKAQVWGYCYAYEESKNPDRPLFGAVRDTNSLTVVWQEKYTDASKQIVENYISKIEEILSGKVIPPFLGSAKCTNCTYSGICENI